MKNIENKYFLAANSSEGFISYFGDCFDSHDNWKVYIIKGGPGTGKSSFMKKLASKANNKGIKTELFPCSSDPDSLDAVIFTDIKTVILDGTAPHTLDPKYPAVCETILNFGDFWNEENINENKSEIIEFTNENKRLHKSASRYIKSAGLISEDTLNLSESITDKDKCLSFANKLCKKYIPKTNGHSKEELRFLSGITPKGIVFFGNTPLNAFKTNIILEDEYGFASNIIIKKLREYALSQNHEIITIKNCLLPSLMLDGIIIPKLSLSFMRETSYLKFDTSIRRIHAKRFIKPNEFIKKQKRLKTNSKNFLTLTQNASEILKLAKSTHDQLEKYYIKAMDFDRLNEFLEEFSKNYFLNK